MLRRKPVFLIFLLTLTVLSFLQYRLDVVSAQMRGFEIVLKKRERNIYLLSALTETLMKAGDRETVDGHLMDAIRVGWIDFFMLTYKSEVVSYNAVRTLSDRAYATLRENHPPNAVWEFHSKEEKDRSVRGERADKLTSHVEGFRFLDTNLGKGWHLKLGFNIDREAFLAEAEDMTADENRRIFVLGLLLTLAVFFFSARDLLQVASVIRKKGLKGLRELKAYSTEAEILQRGLVGFGETVENLVEKNRTLEAQVLPSLKTELQSGRTPPYDFNCTMLRVDINGFTKIFHSHPLDEFLATINEFFVECSHLISRYNGLIHEFVGDEIIFYLKDEDHSNSFTAALACAGEISRAADRIHQRTIQVNGYPFRVKTSLAHGKIRFGPLLNGFSLAGAPLIETTRILSAVSEKDENTIHFDGAHRIRLHDFVRIRDGFSATLKGMDGERRIVRYEGHRKVEDVIAVATDRTRLADYRSDEDIAVLLGHLNSGDLKQAMVLVSFLSTLKLTRISPGLYETVLAAVREFPVADDLPSRRVYASLIAAIPHLIPRSQWGDGVTDLLLSLLENGDGRVVANAVEALTTFDGVAEAVDEQMHTLANATELGVRTRANAIVFLARREISHVVIRHLARMLDSTDDSTVLSALYALGEIARRHRESDPVYFRTQTDFLMLFEQVERWLQRSEKRPRLKRLAERALRLRDGVAGEKLAVDQRRDIA